MNVRMLDTVEDTNKATADEAVRLADLGGRVTQEDRDKQGNLIACTVTNTHRKGALVDLPDRIAAQLIAQGHAEAA